MGPVRRRLTGAALLALIASPAAAEVCDKMRPGWDGTPVSAVDEMLFLAQSPIVLVLIVLTALVLRFRSEWGGVAVVVGWSIATYLVTDWGRGNPTQIAAMNEGCSGNPALFIAVAAALCVGVVLYTAPLGKRKQQ